MLKHLNVVKKVSEKKTKKNIKESEIEDFINCSYMIRENQKRERKSDREKG